VFWFLFVANVNKIPQQSLNINQTPKYPQQSLNINQSPKNPQQSLNINQSPKYPQQSLNINQSPKYPQQSLNINQLPKYPQQSLNINQSPKYPQQSLNINQTPKNTNNKQDRDAYEAAEARRETARAAAASSYNSLYQGLLMILIYKDNYFHQLLQDRKAYEAAEARRATARAAAARKRRAREDQVCFSVLEMYFNVHFFIVCFCSRHLRLPHANDAPETIRYVSTMNIVFLCVMRVFYGVFGHVMQLGPETLWFVCIMAFISIHRRYKLHIDVL
jgi:hypothetical protein